VRKERLKAIIIILITGYVIASLLLYLFQEKLIFQGDTLERSHRFRFNQPYSEIDLEMDDGAVINVLYFEVHSPKGLILYYHGNAGNLAGWGYVAEAFLSQGYNIAIMDYRGYGKSTGELSQKAILNDALAFYDEFVRGFSKDQIILYGRSLGTGIAAYVASQRPVDKLILETPYYNFTSLVQSHVPVFPAGPALKYKFKTNRYVKDVSCPIYIFHGTDDMIVPFKQGRRLYESIPEGQATMIEIEGGDHNNLDNYGKYWDYLSLILE
jgi:pimeloyl-ACP methyl ester carboxylesterase